MQREGSHGMAAFRELELADPLDGLDQPGGFDGQGGADVAVGGPAEAEARAW